MDKKQNFVWIDLEMTGLDARVDHILEIALIVTDANLQILHKGFSCVIHQPDAVLAAMNQYCTDLHAKSGLTESVRASSVTVAQAQEQILAIIKQFCEPRTAVLAGNSIWQDRTFLAQYMPQLTEYLHYRLLDVSSFKEIITRWYAQDPQAKFKKAESHRALVDIYESIAELAHYRKYFFKN
jgi:oligoribonuclease